MWSCWAMLLGCLALCSEQPFIWGVTGTCHTEAMAEAGVRAFRFDLSWRAVEPRIGGPLKWRRYDALIARQAARGLRPHLIVGNGFIGHAPDVRVGERWLRLTPDRVGRERYLTLIDRHVRQVVRRYRDRVSLWQIENEPNVAGPTVLYRWREGRAWWSPDFMRRLMATLYRAVKAEAPDGRVVINFHTDLPGWQRTVRSWRAWYDICGVDAYPNYLSATRVRADLLGARLRRARRISGKPVLVSETGCPRRSELSGHSDAFQARYVAAAATEARRAGAVGFFLFTCSSREKPHRTGNRLLDRLQSVEGWFGVIGPAGRRHPAFRAYRRVIRQAR